MNRTLTSIEMKYLLKGEITNKDVASLFISWAIKGYIFIDEKENLIVITKLRDIYDERDFEEWLFNRLFKTNNVVILNDLYGKLYSEFQTIMIASKRYLSKLDKQIIYKVQSFIMHIMIVFLYHTIMFQLTSNHFISVVGGILYLLPHAFGSYILQGFFQQENHLGNTIWGSIIYASFTGALLGITSLGDISIGLTLFVVFIATIITILIGYLRYRKNTTHSSYQDAVQHDQNISLMNNLDSLSFVDLILLNHTEKYKLEKVIHKNEWNNFNKENYELIMKVDQLLEKLGRELAPTPLPSGTVAASK